MRERCTATPPLLLRVSKGAINQPRLPVIPPCNIQGRFFLTAALQNTGGCVTVRQWQLPTTDHRSPHPPCRPLRMGQYVMHAHMHGVSSSSLQRSLQRSHSMRVRARARARAETTRPDGGTSPRSAREGSAWLDDSVRPPPPPSPTPNSISQSRQLSTHDVGIFSRLRENRWVV